MSIFEIARDYIKMVDRDKNEQVDFDEFKEFCSLVEYKHQNEEQMQAIFDLIDDDHSRLLDLHEFARAVNYYYNDAWQ